MNGPIFWLTIAVYGGGSLLGWLVLRSLRNRLATLQDPAKRHEAQAELLSLFRRGNSNGGTAHMARVAFSDWKGMQHEANITLSSTIWESLAQGQKLPVWYNRQNPKLVAAPERVEPMLKTYQLVLTWMPISAIVALVGLTYFFMMGEG